MLSIPTANPLPARGQHQIPAEIGQQVLGGGEAAHAEAEGFGGQPQHGGHADGVAADVLLVGAGGQHPNGGGHGRGFGNGTAGHMGSIFGISENGAEV